MYSSVWTWYSFIKICEYTEVKRCFPLQQLRKVDLINSGLQSTGWYGVEQSDEYLPAEPAAGICVWAGGPSRRAELPTRRTGPSPVLHTSLPGPTHNPDKDIHSHTQVHGKHWSHTTNIHSWEHRFLYGCLEAKHLLCPSWQRPPRGSTTSRWYCTNKTRQDQR